MTTTLILETLTREASALRLLFGRRLSAKSPTDTPQNTTSSIGESGVRDVQFTPIAVAGEYAIFLAVSALAFEQRKSRPSRVIGNRVRGDFPSLRRPRPCCRPIAAARKRP